MSLATLQSLYNSEPVQTKLRTFVPLILMLVCSPTVILFWYTNVTLSGSFESLFELFAEQGLFTTIYNVWSPVFFGSKQAWTMLGIFAVFELILSKVLPGKPFAGPITPKGNTPIYKSNGFSCYAVTLLAFYLGSYQFNLFSPTIIYDNFGPLLGALNLFSLIFCLFLYLKGKYAPSSTDAGSTGNVIFDYYWGTELYPRIFGWDIKQFTNCRMGMTGWAIIILSFAAKQQEVYGLSNSLLISVGLQLIYITKFFIWETGYLRSLDIMHDRAGYYICWGCLVWVPGIYTSPTLYLVNHPNQLPTPLALLIFALGTSFIMINYLADRQRQKVRLSPKTCKIWGKNPLLTIARYTTENGEQKENVLLASGWWGLSRHFHYVPEILGALCWSLPALFYHFLPYFYVVFLTILLIERAFRDDRRCERKYKNDWKTYCNQVPYKIIPYII